MRFLTTAVLALTFPVLLNAKPIAEEFTLITEVSQVMDRAGNMNANPNAMFQDLANETYQVIIYKDGSVTFDEKKGGRFVYRGYATEGQIVVKNNALTGKKADGGAVMKSEYTINRYTGDYTRKTFLDSPILDGPIESTHYGKCKKVNKRLF